MLSILAVTLAIASVATNSDMKTNLVNYTTPETERIIDPSGVASNQDRVLGSESIGRNKIDEDPSSKKKPSEECQGRQLCANSRKRQIDDVLNISTSNLVPNITNKTGKVIIETQIPASYRKFNVPERTTEGGIDDKLITSSGNSVKESDKKFKVDSGGEEPHKSSHSDDVPVRKVGEEFVGRNKNLISTTSVPEKNRRQDKATPTLSKNQSIPVEGSATNGVALQDPLNYGESSSNTTKTHEHKADLIWTTHSTLDRQRKLSSQPLSATTHAYTSPLRSDDSSESNVLSGKNLNDTTDFSGSSLRPTWETTPARTVAGYNSVGRTHNHTTGAVSATTPGVSQATSKQPKAYGVLKYGNETRRRPPGPIADLKSHMETATHRTLFNFITTETSRDLESYVVDVVTGTRSAIDDVASASNSSEGVSKVIQQEIPWPVKKEAVVEGDLVLGGLMMVHEREDTITCGPVMPQGGIQALEAMLYTLDRLNFGPEPLLPNITLGAHILDDCDKDTYGLEMAVDFIKGKWQTKNEK